MAYSITKHRSPTLLILGGTREGLQLAQTLTARTDWQVISSLAGRLQQPRQPPGVVRVGGFGGVAGLIAYLQQTAIDTVIDATHPFASTMAWNAARACEHLNMPLLRLERPAWEPQPADRWTMVADWQEAVARMRQHTQRALLALGRQELAPFAELDRVRLVIRSVDAPDPMPPFADAQIILARGPFELASERALLTQHGIDTIVCKNSGGQATDAKLTAARELGIRVIMRRRPARPETVVVNTVEAAWAWLANEPY